MKCIAERLLSSRVNSLRTGLTKWSTKNGTVFSRLSSSASKAPTLIAGNRVSLLGICHDENSSFSLGCSLAPQMIRETMLCSSSNTHSELGFDVCGSELLRDLGDIRTTKFMDQKTGASGHPEQITSMIQKLLETNAAGEPTKPFILGGDHSVSFPVLKAFIDHYLQSKEPDHVSSEFVILHIDAHPDLYPELGGDVFSHATPFARTMEYFQSMRTQERSKLKLLQLGIRTLNDTQRETIATYNAVEKDMIRLVEMKDFPETRNEMKKLLQDFLLSGSRTFAPAPGVASERPSRTHRVNVYVSVDLDCLEGLPGVSHYEPGGMTTRQLLNVIHLLAAMKQNAQSTADSLQGHAEEVRVELDIVGADLVEFNPTKDINMMTAKTSAKVAKEMMALLMCSHRADK